MKELEKFKSEIKERIAMNERIMGADVRKLETYPVFKKALTLFAVIEKQNEALGFYGDMIHKADADIRKTLSEVSELLKGWG